MGAPLSTPTGLQMVVTRNTSIRGRSASMTTFAAGVKPIEIWLNSTKALLVSSKLTNSN